MQILYTLFDIDKMYQYHKFMKIKLNNLRELVTLYCKKNRNELLFCYIVIFDRATVWRLNENV